VPLTRSGFTLLQEIAAYRALKRIYRQENPDLVHHVTIKPVIYGSLAARAAKVAAVVNAVPGLGSVFSQWGAKAATLRFFVNFLYRFAFANINMRVIFQNTEDLMEFLNHKIVRREQTVLIRGSGVDLAAYDPCAEPTSPPVFVLVARMLKEKGIYEFARAAELVKRQHPTWRFLLAGDLDSGNPSALTRIQLNDLQHDYGVEWIGYQADVPNLMAQSHVVCLPTYYREGLPKTLLEASAAQRAMIATDIAGCREVITQGVNGLLVPPRTVEPLAQAMLQLGSDAELRQRLARAAREKAEAVFAVEDVVDHTFRVYDELLATCQSL
ncbi:MAG: glycosyltransferase family 4 protein, partial [Pseudomonadales bacterium]|nr:glycosyltransferase family 4 protein [Pseudomonadales bacterium]